MMSDRALLKQMRKTLATTRGGDIHRGRTGPPEILVREIENALVVRMRVDRHHHPLLDAEGIVDDHDLLCYVRQL
jgi:hypothetical protein